MWRRPDGRALVATADFFTPIVDDPQMWGRISAANAVSDVYAMGATPLFGLNLVAWPADVLPLDLLGEVLIGGSAAADEGGWVVAGGHTVDGPEPMYGQSLTGEVDVDDLLTNAGAGAGQTLVLTKPIGTGILATAVKRCEPADVAPGGRLAASYDVGVAEMARLNAEAAAAATAAAATAATDVTGFGLLGHLHEMCAASGVAAELDAAAIPLLPGLVELYEEGFVPGGTGRNLDHLASRVTCADTRTRTILGDAQTSGGLLFTTGDSAAAEAVDRLRSSGHHAAVVGRLVDGESGHVTVHGTI